MRNRWIAGWVATAFAAGLLMIGAPGAHAGSKGRKNTTIVLGALAAHQLLTGKTTTGLAAAAGTAYAYKRYRDKRKEEKRRANLSALNYRSSDPYAGYRSSVPYAGYRGGNLNAGYQGGDPNANHVNCRQPRTRDEYIDENGNRGPVTVHPAGMFRRRDYGEIARQEAMRNSIYGQAEDRPRGCRDLAR